MKTTDLAKTNPVIMNMAELTAELSRLGELFKRGLATVRDAHRLRRVADALGKIHTAHAKLKSNEL